VGGNQQRKGSWDDAQTSLVLMGAVAGAALTLVLPVQPSRLPDRDERACRSRRHPTASLNLFGDIFERVRSHYVEKPDDSKLVEAAISGMLNGLDPHSSYMDPKGFPRHAGADPWRVRRARHRKSPWKTASSKWWRRSDDTPAAKADVAGRRPIITHIDDEAVQGPSPQTRAVEKMRGAVNSKIRLKIMRKGLDKPLDIAIVPRTIKVRSVRSHVEGDDIGYVRITQFKRADHRRP